MAQAFTFRAFGAENPEFSHGLGSAGYWSLLQILRLICSIIISRTDSRIRRYRARFCMSADTSFIKLTIYPAARSKFDSRRKSDTLVVLDYL
jgi:hypothetical protein